MISDSLARADSPHSARQQAASRRRCLPATGAGLSHRARERGAIALLAMIFISLAMILLASVDIGYLFLQRRNIQKVADMSALAGAQQLARSVAMANDRCASALRVAGDNARLGQNFDGVTTLTCGNWNKDTGPAPSYYTAYAGGVTPSGQSAPNAVQVQASITINSMFGIWGSQQLRASAIAATDAPIAVFSVGARLLEVSSSGMVPGILSALGLKIGGSSLGSYNGLANVTITPSGLLNALGFQIPLTADVGTIKSLAQTTTSGCSNGVCTLEAVLGAITVVGGQQDLVSMLGLQVSQLSLPVRLISDSSGRGGVLTLLDAANGQAALSARIDALSLLSTVLGVADSRRAGSLNVTIPGIASPALQAGIVEPPAIGIGGVGTTAYSAQARVYSNLNPALFASGSPKLSLPLSIDTANAQGTITDMCKIKDGSGNDTATIAVTAPILTVCIGTLGSAPFSTTGSCAANLQPTPLLTGALALTLPPLSFKVLNTNGTVTLAKGQTATVGNNTLQLSTTVANLMQAVLGTVIGQLMAQGQGSITSSSLSQSLLSASGNVLGTAVGTVNSALQALNSFAGGLNNDVKNLLSGSVVSSLTGLGNLLTGLLNSVTGLLANLLGNVACLLSPAGYNQCALTTLLTGTQGSGVNTASNTLLALSGLVEKALQPVLDSLGAALAVQLDNLLGLRIGQVDVTLIDLTCGGGSHVKLVY